jgi:hypothetical protein
MITAIVAVAALLLPWLAVYLGVGIVAGPLLLRHVNRTYGVPVDTLRDTPVAILCWIGILARIVLAEAEHA